MEDLRGFNIMILIKITVMSPPRSARIRGYEASWSSSKSDSLRVSVGYQKGIKILSITSWTNKKYTSCSLSALGSHLREASESKIKIGIKYMSSSRSRECL